MARYTGPRVRISRRFGVPIFGASKYLERKNYGPGMHGPKARRKLTDYALGLIEKQKLRFYYGLMEKQFHGVYERALRQRGVTGETMLQILETRLESLGQPLPQRRAPSPGSSGGTAHRPMGAMGSGRISR